MSASTFVQSTRPSSGSLFKAKREWDGDDKVSVAGLRGEGGRDTGRNRLGALVLVRASIDRAALIFDVVDVEVGVIERVEGIRESPEKAALILEAADVTEGVVERVEAERGTSEWLLSEDAGRLGVVRDVVRDGGRSVAFRGEGGGELDMRRTLFASVMFCVRREFKLSRFQEIRRPPYFSLPTYIPSPTIQRAGSRNFHYIGAKSRAGV